MQHDVDQPPLPIDAEWSGGNMMVTVTFDKPLVDQPLSADNWEAELEGGGRQRADSAVVILPDQVQAMFGIPVAGTMVAYLATPPDVVGQNGLDVEPFEWPFA